MKKFAALFLAAALCMGLSVSASAAELKSDKHTYILSNDVVQVIEYTPTYYDWETQSMKEGTPFTVYQVPEGTVVCEANGLWMSYDFYIENDEGGPGENCKSVTITSKPDWYPELSNRIFYTVGTLAPDDQIYGDDGLFMYWDEGITLEAVDAAAVKPAAPTAPSFGDVKESDYFFESVNWAVEKGITNGTSAVTFSPNDTCTQAQIITFLWRANGSPAATTNETIIGVSEEDYFYTAVVWAKNKGIIDDSFSPYAPCTRAAAVTYMYNNAGKPAVTYGGKFTDVSAGATASAVQWALNEGVTTGTSGTTFSPETTCTRGQIVTFLYRDLG